VLLGSLAFLVLGFGTATRLKPQFFPKDHSYLSTVDIWLPEDATVSATHQAVDQVEAVIREVATELEQHPAGPGHGGPRPILRSPRGFVGGGGPRFWNSLNPEPRQSNYALIMVETWDKHDTKHLVSALQPAFDARIPGARVKAKELETGAAVGIP